MIRPRFVLALVLSASPLCAAAVCAGGPMFPHIVNGNGWKTTFYLLNQSAAEADYTLVFRDDAGKPDILHFLDGRADNQISGTVPAGGIAILETSGKDADALNAAAAVLRISSPNALTGFTIVRERQEGKPDFETSIPLIASSSGAWSIPFDNAAGFSTGIALAGPCAGRGPIQIAITAFDEAGKSIGKASVALATGGHTAFLVADQLPATREKRGTIRILTDKAGPTPAPITAVGLRFSPSGALATLPPAIAESHGVAPAKAPVRKQPVRRAH